MTEAQRLAAAERILARLAAEGQALKLPTPALPSRNEILLPDGAIVDAAHWRPECGTACPMPTALHYRAAGELAWSPIPPGRPAVRRRQAG